MVVCLSKNKVIIALVLIIIVLGGFALYFRAELKGHSTVLHPGQGYATAIQQSRQVYPFLDPKIQDLTMEEMEEYRESYQASYTELKNKIINKIQPDDNCAIYFENMNRGAWFGINERKTFTTGSLLKVPVMAAVYKNIEEGTLTLKTPITIQQEDLDTWYGPLGHKGAGGIYTIEELLFYETFFSDNTANLALHRQLSPLDFEDAVLGLGLSYKSFVENKGNLKFPLSAKEISYMFRTLYYSGYLKRKSSNAILELLTKTEFNDGIRAGVPKEIPVAHKYGRWYDGNYVHDCGIVFFPDNPYILCVMTQDMTEEEAYKKSEEISRIIFEYERERVNEKN